MNKFIEINLLKNLSRVGKGKIYKNYWELLNQATDVDDLINLMEKNSNFSRKVLEIAKEDAEDLYKYIVDSDITVITVFDEEYPKKLMKMGNKRPLILYIKGNIEALSKLNLAVIGTRKPSMLSQHFEENLVKQVINSSDRVIVSGLALGCDKIAHKSTVDENETTIAILPSGINVITPASHKKLAQEIIETGGCLISEYNPNAKAFKGTYVERDQVVAALSDAIFVIECGVKSGTMHTVEFANEYKTPIFSFLPTERPENSYDGNEFILNRYDAIKVEYVEEFLSELDLLNITNSEIDISKGDVQSKLI